MTKINWTSIFILIQKLAFWSSLLIIPLSMSIFFPIFSPFTLIKFFWLQFLATLILLAGLLSFKKRSIEILTCKRFILSISPVLIFLLVWSLMSFFSLNPLQTWLGSYSRKMGLVFYYFLTVYFVYIVYSFSGFNFKKGTKAGLDWFMAVKRLSKLFVLAASLVSTYAILQFVGLDFIVWQEPQMLNRTIATLGQPNFLASFLILTLPVSVFLLFKQNKFKFKFLILLALALQLFALLTTGSRAAWLALIVTVSLVTIIYSWSYKYYRNLLILPIFIISLLGLIYLLTPVRLQSLVNLNEGSIALRRSFYSSALKIIPLHPLVGTGLENGAEIIVSQYRPDWGIFMNVDSYPDKVHNSYLDIIIQTGFIGLIFWLVLYAFFIWQCWRLWLIPRGRSFALAAGASMFAYSFALLFGLSDITGVFYFWILAAFVISGNLSLRTSDKNYFIFLLKIKFKNFFSLNISSRVKSLLFRILAIVLVVLAIGQVYISISSLQSDYYFLQVNRLVATQKYFYINELSSYIQQTEYNPVDLQHYENSIASFALMDFERLTDLSSKKIVQGLINSIDQNLPASNYENKITKARAACFLRGAESAQSSFEEIISMSPMRPAGYRYLANCLQSSFLSEEALLAYDSSFSFLPDDNDSRLNFDHRGYLFFYKSQLKIKQAETYQDLKLYNQAAYAYREAYYYFPQDISLLKKSAELYYLVQNLDETANILQEMLRFSPNDTQVLLDLSKVYTQLNQNEKAQIYLQQAHNFISE